MLSYRMEAIDRLISQGIILPVDSADWGTPIVPVLKSDGSVRICADYKVTLNKAVKPYAHHIPVIAHLFSSIGPVNIFARLDLAQAYHQIPVSENLAKTQTIVTFVLKRESISARHVFLIETLMLTQYV